VEETSSLIQANKPVPAPNLTTNDIAEIYPLFSLVFPGPASRTLEMVPIDDWQAKIANKEPVECGSRFVAFRSTHVIKAANANPESQSHREIVQILRYTLILIELAYYLKTVHTDRRLPPVAKCMSWITAPVPPALIEKILTKYCPNGPVPSKFNMTLLRTTILALTLHIPPPSGNHGVGIMATETFDIQQDLALTTDEVRTLYRELGCKWEAATDAELERWGLKKRMTKEGAQGLMFAKLKFPIDFPKVSRGMSMGKHRK